MSTSSAWCAPRSLMRTQQSRNTSRGHENTTVKEGLLAYLNEVDVVRLLHTSSTNKNMTVKEYFNKAYPSKRDRGRQRRDQEG